jgi:hypothetical protein
MNKMHDFLTPMALAVALTLCISATAAAAPMQRADTTVITGRVTSEGAPKKSLLMHSSTP